MVFLGVDIGSLSCDAVLVDDEGEMRAWTVVPTGARNVMAIERARQEVLRKAGAEEEEVGAVIATGYGRDRVDGRLASVTEITCHARGVSAKVPGAEVLIDIGGQDSKALRLDPKTGVVLEFSMNDKCAAGTGRFLEAMARALEVGVEQLGSMDRGANDSITLSSMCTVFAESEVVSLIAEGEEVAEIVRGLNRAIATRTQGLVKRVAKDVLPRRPTVAMSGGVARNRGVVAALEAALGCPITVPEEPDTIGALGAALIARDRATRAISAS